ncbi:hypothetical protein ACEW7V_01660 [Areca yellow leaf disease phytoplasma]|uniref:hypothetical protein n=1 Tax=Areca yellow leaf disease phytoplasma TaxID=927614 RepID=UPI0035B4FBD0
MDKDSIRTTTKFVVAVKKKQCCKDSHLRATNGIIYQEVCHKKTLLNSKRAQFIAQNNFAYLAIASAVFQKEGEN